MADRSDPRAMLNPLVGYHLRRASAAFTADFVRVMDGTGMRQVLIGILVVVGAEPGINQGAVGRLLGIKRANMVALINELVDRHLIAREIDPNDRRAFALGLTAAGETMLETCFERIDEHERELLAGFSAAERAMLLELLARIERREPDVG